MTLHSDWRRNQFVLTSVSFIGYTGFTLVMPFLPLYIQSLGVSDVAGVAMWSGLSLGVTPGLTALLSPAWGRVADRFGRKLMVERSLLSFVVIMSALAFVSKPWHVFALRAFQGLFAGYGSLTLAMAAEIAPREKMASAIGLVQTAQRLGPALGPVIGGLIAGLVGLRNAFLVTAGFYVVALLLTVFAYREPATSRSVVTGEAPDRPVARDILKFENFVLLIIGIFALQVVDRSFGPILPLYVSSLGFSEASIAIVSGLLFSVMAIAAALGHHLAGRLMKRHQPAKTVIMWGTAGSMLGIVVCLAAPGVWLLGAGLGVCGVGIGAAMTAAYTAAGLVIPAGVHGSAFGLLSAASLTGLAISPVIAGFVGGAHIRLVFLLDLVILIALAPAVRRYMSNRGMQGGC